MLTYGEMRRIAMRQSAADLNAREEDFVSAEHVITAAGLAPGAKRYYEEPISCNFVSYGGNIVAATQPEYREIVTAYIHKFTWYHCFEMPNLHWLSDRLEPLGQRVCFMAEYFLPDPERLKPLPCGLETRVLTPADFAELYKPEWSNALCEKRRQLDMLGVGAYENGVLVGLAGCSADAEEMWQIGVDVLPACRRRGIAAALTSELALEILKRDKVPFYCCAWSNVNSAGNAVKSGFRPAWVEMSVKPRSVVDDMNK